jgi:hypothetical protein
MSMSRASPSQKPKGSMKRWRSALHRNPQGEYEALGRDRGEHLYIRLIHFIFGSYYIHLHSRVEILFVNFTETREGSMKRWWRALHRNPQGEYEALGKDGYIHAFPPLTVSTYRLFHRNRKGVWSARVRDPSQKPARGVWSAGFSVPVLDSAPPPLKSIHIQILNLAIYLFCFFSSVYFLFFHTGYKLDLRGSIEHL